MLIIRTNKKNTFFFSQTLLVQIVAFSIFRIFEINSYDILCIKWATYVKEKTENNKNINVYAKPFFSFICKGATAKTKICKDSKNCFCSLNLFHKLTTLDFNERLFLLFIQCKNVYLCKMSMCSTFCMYMFSMEVKWLELIYLHRCVSERHSNLASCLSIHTKK